MSLSKSKTVRKVIRKEKRRREKQNSRNAPQKLIAPGGAAVFEHGTGVVKFADIRDTKPASASLASMRGSANTQKARRSRKDDLLRVWI